MGLPPNTTRKGYRAEDFHDAWSRYLPKREEGEEGEEIDKKDKNLADLALLAANGEKNEEDRPADNDPFATLKDPRHKLPDDLEIPGFLRRTGS